jgi:hypothetical protein
MKRSGKQIHLNRYSKVFGTGATTRECVQRFKKDGRFAWISEHEVLDKLAEGFTYYRGPKDGARRYQIPNESLTSQDKAFFM